MIAEIHRMDPRIASKQINVPKQFLKKMPPKPLPLPLIECGTLAEIGGRRIEDFDHHENVPRNVFLHSSQS